MSKELPYFQYEPAEYLAGDIVICSLQAQGLFAIIQCLYWQKECSLNARQVLKRYNHEDLLDELVEESIIKIDDQGEIQISFLDEQFEELLKRKKRLSKAGKKGAEAKKEKLKTSAASASVQAPDKPSLSQASTTLKQPEEKRREEKRIEKKRIENKRKTIIERKEEFLSATQQIFETSYSENISLLKPFFEYWTEAGSNDLKLRFEKEKTFGLERRIKTWLSNEKKFNKTKGENENSSGSVQGFFNLDN